MLRRAAAAVRRKTGGGDALPLSSHPSSVPDGSGKAVKMDAPIVRAWKNADPYTRWTYYWLLGTICLIWVGVRHLRVNHASMWLVCHATSCTLSITLPGLRRKSENVSIELHRSQIVSADNVKVDSDNNFVKIDNAYQSPYYAEGDSKGKKGKKKKYKTGGNSKGPDPADGLYWAYAVTLSEYRPADREVRSEDREVPIEKSAEAAREAEEAAKIGEGETIEAKVEEFGSSYSSSSSSKAPPSSLEEFVPKPNNLAPLLPYLIPDPASSTASPDRHVLLFRRFGMSQTRRRCRSMVTRINSYAKKRRHKMTIKESRGVTWQGIVAIVLGVFGLLMCVLIGQFVDPENEGGRYGGPGGRRRRPQPKGGPPKRRTDRGGVSSWANASRGGRTAGRRRTGAAASGGGSAMYGAGSSNGGGGGNSGGAIYGRGGGGGAVGGGGARTIYGRGGAAAASATSASKRSS